MSKGNIKKYHTCLKKITPLHALEADKEKIYLKKKIYVTFQMFNNIMRDMDKAKQF